MKVKVTVKRIYEFGELTNDAKSTAIRNIRESANWSWNSFASNNEYSDKISQEGFTDPDISWSGFWSQGDGYSFTSGIDFDILAKRPDFQEVLKKVKHGKLIWKVLQSDFEGKVKRTNHHYCHSYTCKVEIDEPQVGSAVHPRLYEEVGALTSYLEEWIDGIRVELCHALYRDLEKSYYAFYEEAHVTEMCEVSGIYFTECGEILECDDAIETSYASASEVELSIKKAIAKA